MLVQYASRTLLQLLSELKINKTIIRISKVWFRLQNQSMLTRTSCSDILIVGVDILFLSFSALMGTGVTEERLQFKVSFQSQLYLCWVHSRGKNTPNYYLIPIQHDWGHCQRSYGQKSASQSKVRYLSLLAFLVVYSLHNIRWLTRTFSLL